MTKKLKEVAHNPMVGGSKPATGTVREKLWK